VLVIIKQVVSNAQAVKELCHGDFAGVLSNLAKIDYKYIRSHMSARRTRSVKYQVNFRREKTIISLKEISNIVLKFSILVVM